MWELRFANSRIVETALCYGIPVRTLRRYRDISTQGGHGYETVNGKGVQFEDASHLPNGIPLPPRTVQLYRPGFTYFKFEEDVLTEEHRMIGVTGQSTQPGIPDGTTAAAVLLQRAQDQQARQQGHGATVCINGILSQGTNQQIKNKQKQFQLQQRLLLQQQQQQQQLLMEHQQKLMGAQLLLAQQQQLPPPGESDQQSQSFSTLQQQMQTLQQQLQAMQAMQQQQMQQNQLLLQRMEQQRMLQQGGTLPHFAPPIRQHTQQQLQMMLHPKPQYQEQLINNYQFQQGLRAQHGQLDSQKKNQKPSDLTNKEQLNANVMTGKK